MILRLIINALVSGLTALDTLHAFQWMLSRPIVAGTISGFVMGDMATGMLCGACIELIWIGVLPIGNYTPPDAHAAAVSASTVASIWNQGQSGPEPFVLLAVLLTVPVGILSKYADLHLRRALAVRVEKLMATDPPYDIAPLGMIAVLTVFSKGALIVLMLGVFAMVVEPLVLELAEFPNFREGMTFAFSLVPALGMVQLALCLGARGRERFIAAGAVSALVVYFLLGFSS